MAVVIHIRRAIREVEDAREQARGGATLGVCAHCHLRNSTTRLFRVPLVGWRPICDDCRPLMEARGYGDGSAA